MANITVSATAGMVFVGSAFAMWVAAAINKDAQWLAFVALGVFLIGVVSWFWSIAQAKQYDKDAKQDRVKLFQKLDKIIEKLP